VALGVAVALDRDRDAGCSLLHTGNGTVELQIEIGMSTHPIVQDARQLGLLALHAVRVLRGVGNGAEIELRQQAMLLRAILERGCLEPLREQGLGSAERVQHVERRWMEGRGARFLAEPRPLLEHRHRHAAVCQMGRSHEPDRARACDENALVVQWPAYWICLMPALVMMSRYRSISSWWNFFT
jgi:hypothetical protein